MDKDGNTLQLSARAVQPEETVQERGQIETHISTVFSSAQHGLHEEEEEKQEAELEEEEEEDRGGRALLASEEDEAEESESKITRTAARVGVRLRSRSSAIFSTAKELLLTKERLWPTTICALVQCLKAVLVGYTIGFPSSSLLELTDETSASRLPSGYQFSPLLSGLYAAIGPLGAIFGGPMAGLTADHWGRKPSLLLCGVPYLTGYLMISYAHYLPTPTAFKTVMIAGRVWTGVGTGWASVGTVYIAEISSAKFRGIFGSLGGIGLAAGILLDYSIGSIPGFPYYYSSLVAAGIATAYVVLMVLLKESPRWLVSKGHCQKARNTLLWLRGKKIDIEEEIRGIKSSKKMPSIWKTWKEFKHRSVTVPVLVILVLVAFQQAGGIGPMSAYAASIFKDAGLSSPQVTATYSVGGTQFAVSLLTLFIVDLFGRKFLLVCSGLGMMLGSILLGVHFYITRPSLCSPSNSTLSNINMADLLLQDSPTTTPCNTQYAPLAIISVIVYVSAFSFGWGPVPGILLPEVVPLRVRGLISGIAPVVNLGVSAIVVFLYPVYTGAVGLWFCWWTFTVLNGAAVVFILIFVKETRGKSLEDIEEFYRTHRF